MSKVVTRSCIGTERTLLTDPRITDAALAAAVREIAMQRDLEVIFQRAAVIATQQENKQ